MKLESDPETVIDRVISFLGLDMRLKRKQSEVGAACVPYDMPMNPRSEHNVVAVPLRTCMADPMHRCTSTPGAFPLMAA